MGTVSIEIPGPGTYQVQCDPKLPALADGGTSGDVLAGKQFYNDQNAPVTGTMPNNPPQAVELSGGNSYTIPRGFHDGTGKVTGVGTVLPDLPSPAGAGDILAGKQAVSGDGTRLTGIMPNNPPEDVEVSGGESYQIPEGYHTGAGKVTGKGTVLPELTDPATAADILIRKEVIDQSGQELAGTMPNNGAVSAELAAGGSYTIPAGYHNGQGKVISTAVPLPSLSDPAVSGDILSGKEAIDGTGAKVTGTMPAVAAATPTISVSPDGLITATAQQAEGYVEAATETAAQQLETQGAQTIVPGTADQTVPAGKFLTGAQTIQGDAGLLPENIKKGVSLFGVDGSYEPGLPTDLCTITLAADPPEGGTVSGGGLASEGMTITIDVKPSDEGNFFFNGWEEDGNVLSIEPKYTFEVSTDRNLIAKFMEVAYVAGVDWWNTVLPDKPQLRCVAYGNGKFIATPYLSYSATSDKIYISNDCISWEVVTLPKSLNIYSLAFGAGKFVAICTNTTEHMYSEDGTTWHSITLPSTQTWDYICYGDGLFRVTSSRRATVISSEDGLSWQNAPTMPSAGDWESFAFDEENRRIVALDIDILTATNKIAYIDSTLTAWTTKTVPFNAQWKGVAYGNGKFVAICQSDTGRATNKAAYSVDGKTWETITLPVSALWRAIEFGNGRFVITSSADSLWSEDGISWNVMKIPLQIVDDILYANNRFIAISSSTYDQGKAAYSVASGPPPGDT